MLDTFVLRWIDTYRTHSGASSAKSLAIVPDNVEMRQSAIAVAKNMPRRTAAMCKLLGASWRLLEGMPGVAPRKRGAGGDSGEEHLFPASTTDCHPTAEHTTP